MKVLARSHNQVLPSSPAAAAGSAGLGFAEPGAGLSEVRPRGLLLRRDSLTAGGDRERRSNLDVRFGSGSFWSKRERLTARRSVSSILDIKTKIWKNECVKAKAGYNRLLPDGS
jgi:hypothetical protein